MAKREPDPKNQGLQPMEGGSDGLTDKPTKMDQVRSAPWADSEEKGVMPVPNVAKEADTAASAAMMAEPD